MKKLRLLSMAFTAALVFNACSDDDNRPEVVNEEEVITTMTLTLTSSVGNLELESRDLDGDGPEPPVLNVDGWLLAGVEYSGSIVFLNETVSPSENITEEVNEESNEHQVFYTPGNGLDVTVTGENLDDEGNKLGTQLTLTAGEVGSGTLTVSLRHQPKKPNSGLSDAGGETDFTATFEVDVFGGN